MADTPNSGVLVPGLLRETPVVSRESEAPGLYPGESFTFCLGMGPMSPSAERVAAISAQFAEDETQRSLAC